MQARWRIYLYIMLLSINIFAQNDTIRQLKPIEIFAPSQTIVIQSSYPVQTLNQKQIASMPVIQLSDALKFLSGVTIKDYGGLGGMKTVSIRGFGAQHTALSYDGIAVTDCQTGQIDIGKLFLDNVETISLTHGGSDDIFIPAQLYASANLVQIKTKKPVFKTDKPFNIQLGFKGGSFTFLNPYLVLENKWIPLKKKSSIQLLSTLSFDYLYSKGNYPYTQYYGYKTDSTSQEIRKNSDIQTISTQVDIYALLKKQATLNFKLYYYYSQRGLPGAVILYNTNTQERLWNEETFAQIHYEQLFHPKITYQLNAKINYAYQRYLDSDYLNEAGVLDNRYIQRTAYLSNSVLYKPFKIWQLVLSNDLIYQNMSSNMTDFAKPQRFSVLTLLSTKVETKYIETSAGILYHSVFNEVKIGESGENVNKITPSIAFSIKPIPQIDFKIIGFYKNIFRLPSFNDLYYRDIGNINLKPENTHQFNLGLNYNHYFMAPKIQLTASLNGYYNIVKDKIVAIPTKNLFIWSMYNFGRVEIAGLDINMNITYQIIPLLQIELLGTYTYQRSIDVTEQTSKTYKHQIPYIPEHSGSICLALKLKWINLIYTVLVTGERYALPQNITDNLLETYADQSIALSKDFHFAKWGLALKAELLNIANEQYEIIKNYPMQGRSFRFGISFDF